VFGSLGQGFIEVVDVKNKEGWAKVGALRDTASDSKRAASSTMEEAFALLSERKDRIQRTKQGGRPRVSSLEES